jgi:hypothetical protein
VYTLSGSCILQKAYAVRITIQMRMSWMTSKRSSTDSEKMIKPFSKGLIKLHLKLQLRNTGIFSLNVTPIKN